ECGVRIADRRRTRRAAHPARREVYVLTVLRLVGIICVSGLALTRGGLPAAAPRPPDIPFAIHLLDPGASETAAVADINRDGRLDIVSGENWYEGPTWAKHRFRELNYTQNYVDVFSDLPLDVDGDGYPDIISVSWFGRKISWWKNPGTGAGP